MNATYAQHGLMPCQFCRNYTPSQIVKDPGVNHTLHLVLTLFTLGLWLPLWALFTLTGTSGGVFSHCACCGNRRSR